MEKIFMYARMLDILHQMEIKTNQVKRMVKYPPTQSTKVQWNRVMKAMGKVFDCIWLIQEYKNLQRKAKINFPLGGIVCGPANGKDSPGETILPLGNFPHENPTQAVIRDLKGGSKTEYLIKKLK